MAGVTDRTSDVSDSHVGGLFSCGSSDTQCTSCPKCKALAKSGRRIELAQLCCCSVINAVRVREFHIESGWFKGRFARKTSIGNVNHERPSVLHRQERQHQSRYPGQAKRERDRENARA
jgi:hypothetical protein